MRSLELLTLPTFRFAHIHKADSYHHAISENHSRLEISYLAEGSLHLQIPDRTFTSHKGEIVCSCLEPLTIHTDQFHCHHTVCADVQWRYCDTPGHLLLPVFISDSTDAGDIRERIDHFIYHSYTYENAPEKAACDVLQILCKIDHCSRNLDHFKESEGSILVHRAKKYIHRNIYSPITQEEVAAHLGITPGYLCSIFRKSEHTTVIKYINTLKLRQIQELMEYKHLKLHEASAMFGYSDPNYVSALYKKMFGHNITSQPSRSPLKPNKSLP